MTRRKWSWTDVQTHRLALVKDVIESLRKYWPLTMRQIHYQLYARQVDWGGLRESGRYPNSKAGYQDLIRLAKYGRIGGMIPWSTISDDHRQTYTPYKFEDLAEYFKNELSYLFNDYQRCKVQDQDFYIEIWVEKQALFRIFKGVGSAYCIPVVACTGYDSITYLHNFKENARAAIARGQQVAVLYFGDLDPSGENMLEASKTTLFDEMALPSDMVAFHRMAVIPEQVDTYGLPNDPDGAKAGDKRLQGYLEKYGNLFVELDAFNPAQLEDLIRSSIGQYLDMAAFEAQAEIEAAEGERLERVQQRVVDVINEEMGTFFSLS